LHKKNWQIKPEYPAPKAAKVQLNAIYGKNGLKEAKFKKNYLSAAHFDLITALVPLRNNFQNPR